MEIVLYYAPITCALAPYITLTEAGAKFEVRPLNFRKGQHTSPEYLKINPKHKVPLLIVDGKVLSESVAIQTWIARTFPQAKLLPADPVARVAGDLIDVVVLRRHPSVPGAHQLPAAGLRRSRHRREREEARGRELDGVVQDRR